MAHSEEHMQILQINRIYCFRIFYHCDCDLPSHGSRIDQCTLWQNYRQNNLKQRTLGIDATQGPMKFILKCASCCIACFERLIRFLTDNAYIMMAITGKNFCSSAQESFYLVLRSGSQYAVTYGATKIFVFIGKACIVSLSALSGYLIVMETEYLNEKIYYPLSVTIAFVIASFPVPMVFMEFFEMAANSLLVCICLEMDLLRGNSPKCPQALRKFLDCYVR